MFQIEIFRLFGTVSINKAKAIADLKAVEAAGRTSGSKLGAALSKIATVAKVAFAAVAAAAAGIFVAAIKKAADYELAMAKVRAITGASAEEFAAMSEEAKRLGLETAQTMTDIAAGMEALGRAGFSANEIIAAMGGVVALAESQTMELGQAVRDRACQLAESVDISDKLNRYATKLSQGEKQRVAVCRALLPEPTLLLADEPTGNLDPNNKGRVLDILFDYARRTGATLVTVTHDFDLVERFGSVVDFRSFHGTTSGADA